MPFLRTFTSFTLLSTASAGGAWAWFTRSTRFVPLTIDSPDLPVSLKTYFPSTHKPVCVDEAVRRVPFSQLKTTDHAKLTTEFCRGVWGGPGYAIQRLYLERKYRGLPGREDQLWDREELKASTYIVGTKITDHFEVVERDVGKVVVRCGDSPLVSGPRESDGLFSIEVTTDKDAATFHLKSIFFNSTPEGAKGGSLPPHIDFLHREYAKLWMETSVRKLLK